MIERLPVCWVMTEDEALIAAWADEQERIVRLHVEAGSDIRVHARNLEAIQACRLTLARYYELVQPRVYMVIE